MQILENLEKFFLTEITTGSGKTSLDPDEDLLEHGMLDSMGIMKLIVYLEETFAIKVEDEEIIPENFQNLNSMVAFVDQKMQSQRIKG